MKVHHCPSYYRVQNNWREKHNLIAIYIPPEVKKRIEDTVVVLGGTSVSKQCSEAIISLFSELDQQRSMIDSVIKSEMIIEGRKNFGIFHFKKSLTEQFCDKKGCGGRMIRLSYPYQTGEKVEIRPVERIICENCGSIKEG